MLSRAEVLKQIADLVAEAEIKLGQATTLATEHNIEFEYNVYDGYEGELEDGVAETLNRWVTSSYGC